MKVPVILILDLNADIVLDMASDNKEKREIARKAIQEATDLGGAGVVHAVDFSSDYVRRLIPSGGCDEHDRYSLHHRRDKPPVATRSPWDDGVLPVAPWEETG